MEGPSRCAANLQPAGADNGLPQPSNMARSERDTLVSKAAELPCGDSQTTSSRKRRRSQRSSPSDTKSKTSSRKITPPRERRRKVENTEAGPSETTAILSDPSELLSRNLKAAATDAQNSYMLENARLPIPGHGINIASAEAQLRILKQNLVEAENQLRQERGQRAQQELQIRQDMYLEMHVAKVRAQQDTQRLERYLRRAQKLLDEKDQAMQELEQKYESTSESLTKHVYELESQRRELQHLQHVNTTLEADIEELRQIHNETSARKRPSGLPPAYGSLDEEDMPPYELHADSGALNVATLKRATRDKYDQSLRKYNASNESHPLAIDLPNPQDVQRFHRASLALYEAASTLTTALSDLQSGMTMDVKTKDESIVRRVAVKHSFVASRAANTLLELVWRTIALNEVRPAARVSYSSRAQAVCKTIYSHVDDVLIELLRKWNGECRSNSHAHPASERGDISRAVEFQVYSSQVSALRASLVWLVGGSLELRTGDFFGKSMDFLQEAVETERMQEAANAAGDQEGEAFNGAAFHRQSSTLQEDANAAFHRDGSVISSVGPANESGREDD